LLEILEIQAVTSGETYKINNEQTSQGYTKELKKSDKIIFEIFDEKFANYTLSVELVGDNFVNLSIRKGPIFIVLGIGQSVKLNLSSPNYYNLYIKLDSIADKKAKLTIQSIRDPIIKGFVKEEVKEKNDTGDKTGGIRELFEDEKESVKKLDIKYIVTIIVLTGVIILLIWLFYIKSKKEIKEEVVKEVKEELKKRSLGRVRKKYLNSK